MSKSDRSTKVESAVDVAEQWRFFSGDTAWSRELLRFGELGGKIKWYSGYPGDTEGPALKFDLILPRGRVFQHRDGGNSRLVDINLAVAHLEPAAEKEETADLIKWLADDAVNPPGF